MTKNEILYNVGLTDKVYSEQKDIDFKAQRLKLIKWIDINGNKICYTYRSMAESSQRTLLGQASTL